MRELANLAFAVFGLYVAGAMLLIGFAMMLMGKVGAQRAARFYFGGSGRWAVRGLRGLLRSVFAAVRALLGWIWHALKRGLGQVFRRRHKLRAGR